MATTREKIVFKKGSITFYNSSLFFPKKIREDVFILYAFVRTADDFVDSTPQNKKGFLDFKKKYLRAKFGKTNDAIVDRFYELVIRKKFDKSWPIAFLKAMESDLTKKKYKTLKETEKYIYGSAEVIGLMMARIMDLDEKSFKYASLLGRAFQYVNFIRDINEDISLGRTYLPHKELKKFGLSTLNKEEVQKNQEGFRNFMNQEINRYLNWQNQAKKGFSFIPYRYRIAIKTASDIYAQTVEVIRKNPFIVYEMKVKPSRYRVILSGLKNSIT